MIALLIVALIALALAVQALRVHLRRRREKRASDERVDRWFEETNAEMQAAWDARPYACGCTDRVAEDCYRHTTCDGLIRLLPGSSLQRELGDR